MTLNIDFSKETTRGVAIDLYRRYIREKHKFQVLYLGTGKGKTAMAIALAGIFAAKLEQDINVFVIAPPKKLEDLMWDETIKEYNQIAKYKLNLVEKATPRGLTNANKNDKLLKRDIKKMSKYRQENMKFLSKWYKQTLETPTIFLVDEAHHFKNAASKQSKALQKLMKNSTGIGLSGTALTNGEVQDGIGYLVLNGYYSSKDKFYKEHVPFNFRDKFYRPDIYTEDGEIDPYRFKNLDLFKKNIRNTIYAPIIEVDFDIPEGNPIQYLYELSPKTKSKMKKHHMDYHERRYDSYMMYLNDLRRAIGEDKAHARELIRIIKHYKPKQPLIFYYTNAELNNIEYALDAINMPYKRINGHNNSDSIATIDLEDTDQAILIQYKSGGEAIEFKKSNMSIFFGLQYSWGDTQQALGRNIRYGMDKNIVVNQVFMVASNHHDIKVLEALQRKQEFTEKFMKELAQEIMEESLEEIE